MATRKAQRKNTRKNTRKAERNAERKIMYGGGGVGSKLKVYHGTASRTAGGLTKADLVMNKRGRIVSKKQQAAGRKAFKHLKALGYAPKKGTFKLFTKKSKRA